jgi:DNA-binding transcriptional MerR regulator
VTVLLTIGEFSKATYLSVKALRHYHDVGLLEPVAVDPATGYRRYAAEQVPTAHAIRRFRELDMPLDEVRRVLAAPDLATRNQAILEHLDRMQAQLARTQEGVASLHALLEEGPRGAPDVSIRSIPSMAVAAVRGTVDHDGCGAWLEQALAGLHDRVASPSGPDGALYPDEFFEDGVGEVVAYVPTPSGDLVLPAVTVAVLVHDGPFAELDQAYGALGTAVAARGIGARGAIREHYLTPQTTEVCWPVRQEDA